VAKITFKGRVLPEVVKISLSDIPTVSWQWPEANLAIGLSVRVNNSIVEVTCDVPHYKSDYLGELHRRAFDVARACVNLGAFSTGLGLIVIFEEYVLPDGAHSKILLNTSPDVLAQVTAFKIPAVTADERKLFEQVLTLVVREPALFMALNDLAETITVPHATAVNCGRVLDAVRNMVAPGAEPKKGWPILRDMLRVDEAYVIFISENSKTHRHGDRTRIDGPTTLEIQKRTWSIMNRFLEFRKQGNQQLPLAEFPLLVG
jgi:hypothetical protein